MDNLLGRLQTGYSYFGSGSYNSEEFNEFYKDFKKSFTYQLKKLNATNIEFSKGHFNITGFFKVEDQYFYFSLSDVRDMNSTMLIRTAKHNEDYTGGTNNYVHIKNGMYKEIARKFRLNIKQTQTKQQDKESIVNKILKEGYVDMYIGSMKKANRIAWALDDKFKEKEVNLRASTSIRVSKFRNAIAYSKCSTDDFDYYYDGNTKRFTINLVNKPFNREAFLKTLTMPKNPQIRVNPFTGAKAELEPEAVALHDFIKEAEIKRTPIFQEALFIFREKYPEAYMTLLD